jgi:hypothetical protein
MLTNTKMENKEKLELGWLAIQQLISISREE